MVYRYICDRTPQGFEYWRSVESKLEVLPEYIEFQGYMELVRRVEKIDPVAGAFMRYLLNTEGDTLSCSDSLSECFLWYDTPQGHKYWAELEEKLLSLTE